MQKYKPRKEKLDFLSWEMGTFFHFGIRTFYEGHRDWDGKIMPLDGFRPESLDCESWITTSKEAGAKYAILVCKHHDGFANWPSKYSDYHVGLTPWKDGKGDVVREFVDACNKHDLKVGLYYSPAEAGYKERSAQEYDDYFIKQISELLSNYGKIDYLWFDGCGSEGHEYDKPRIVKAIRDLQPQILIFNMWDPDTRWVGNEAGAAGVLNINQVSALDFSILTGEEKDEMTEPRFLPSECDFMMRDRNWFYSEYDVHTVKSVEELVGLYYYSVGCGSNFLVNIGPDRRGLLPDVDAQRLKDFGVEIRRRFADPIPASPEDVEDGIGIKFDKEYFINHVVVSEDLTEGDGVEAFEVLVGSRLLYRPICVYAGTAIGNKRIIQIPYIRASRVLVKVRKANGEYKLRKLEAFLVK
ncbi:MAG: alpha-L-fucosidase [Defluviitaleaceae bacterium]|nr:alpha-L-fucosidase [Defluviitaleaceae bacterium]